MILRWLLLGMFILTGILEIAADDNPFKRKTKSPFRRKSASPFVPVPKASDEVDQSTVEPDGSLPVSKRRSRPPKRFRHGKFTPVTGPDDGWAYEPPQQEISDFTPQRVDLTDLDFHDRIKHFDVNRSGRFGTMTTHKTRGNTQIRVMDFQAGEVIASVVTPKELLVLDIDDSGQRLAVVSDAFGSDEKRNLGTFLVGGTVLKEESFFTPFPDLRGHQQQVVSAAFVGDHKMLLVSYSGRVSVWNLQTLREECGFDLNGKPHVVCGPDRDVIAFVDSEKFGLFDIQRQKFPGVAQLPEGMTHCEIAISPRGARLVLSNSSRAMVINAGNGEIQAEVPLTGNSVRKVEFAADDFLLVSNQALYSISDRMLLWSYSGAAESVSVGGRTFFMKEGPAEMGTVIPATLPNPPALAALETAHSQPELFVVRPGVSMQIDVTNVPPKYRETVEQALTKELQNREINVSNDSNLVLVASITGPEKKVVEYGRFVSRGRGYVISEYVSTLEIQWNGQVAWTRKQTNAPGSVSARKGQSIEDALRERTSQPNLYTFQKAGFPSYVQKPDGNSSRSHQALGRTSIDEIRP